MTNKQIVAFFILIVTASSVYVCPSGNMEFQSFDNFKQHVLRYRSPTYDTFYKMTYQNHDFMLNCYRLVDQTQNPDPILQIKSFSIKADGSWRIKAVSERGSCVAVQQGRKLATYNTWSGSFVKVQTIDVSSLGKKVQYKVNDDCSIIQAVLQDNFPFTRKAFKNSVENSDLVLPEGTIYSYDFKYAVDIESNFYTLTNGVYVKNSVPELKQEPLYIKSSSFVGGVIVVTRDQNGYSFIVRNIAKNANTYYKQLLKQNGTQTNYQGQLQFFVRTSYGSIILRDDNGYVKFVQVKKQGDTLVQTEYSLEDSSYKSLFGPSAIVTTTESIIYVYNNNKITYFQAKDKNVTFLGQLPSNILTESSNYQTDKNVNKNNVVLSIQSPSNLKVCNIDADNELTSFVTFNQLLPSTFIDPQTNETIKCPENCLSCTSPEKCSLCQVGYSLNDQTGECIYCQGCLTCSPTNPKICYLCFAPQVYNSTSSTCVLPSCNIQNCLQCDINGACIMCQPIHGLINSTCQKCNDQGCLKCSSGVDSCDVNSCLLGYIYYFDPKTNKSICQSCPTGCNVCSSTDLSACIQCTPGYYAKADADGIKRCETCSDKCQICTSLEKCQICERGYVLSSDKSKCLLKCDQNCLTCDQQNATICLSCFAGSSLDTNKSICLYDTTCNQTGSCKICNKGFTLENGKCLQCKTQDANCINCKSSNLTQCSECKTGYYLDQNICKKCSDNCTSCVGPQACSKCIDGFYLITSDLSLTGKCQICVPECLTCSGTDYTCTSCRESDLLIGSMCISQNRVQLEFVIQANVQNFIQFMNDLIQWIIDQVNKNKDFDAQNIDDNDVAIQRTTKFGSSKVNAVISTQNPDDTNDATQALNNAISQSPSIKGYQIISGSASARTTPVPEKKSQTNLGLILGLSIPLGILILVAIIVIIYKIQQKNSNQSNEAEKNQNMHSNKHLTDSNDNKNERI